MATTNSNTTTIETSELQEGDRVRAIFWLNIGMQQKGDDLEGVVTKATARKITVRLSDGEVVKVVDFSRGSGRQWGRADLPFDWWQIVSCERDEAPRADDDVKAGEEADMTLERGFTTTTKRVQVLDTDPNGWILVRLPNGKELSGWTDGTIEARHNGRTLRYSVRGIVRVDAPHCEDCGSTDGVKADPDDGASVCFPCFQKRGDDVDPDHAKPIATCAICGARDKVEAHDAKGRPVCWLCDGTDFHFLALDGDVWAPAKADDVAIGDVVVCCIGEGDSRTGHVGRLHATPHGAIGLLRDEHGRIGVTLYERAAVCAVLKGDS